MVKLIHFITNYPKIFSRATARGMFIRTYLIVFLNTGRSECNVYCYERNNFVTRKNQNHKSKLFFHPGFRKSGDYFS